MKQTSSRFQEVVNNTGREFQARLVIMTANGNKTYTNNEIIEAKITHELLGEALTLGNITAKKLSLKTVSIPKSELTYNEFYLEIGLKIAETRSVPPQPIYEWVNMGRFKQTEIVDGEKGILTITAYDKLYFAGTEFKTANVPQKATMQQILTAICDTHKIDRFTLSNPPATTYENTVFGGKQDRELLGYIAEYYGGYFIMDENKLKLITLGSSPSVTIDGDIYYDVQNGEQLPINFVEKYYSQEERWYVDGGLGSGLTIAIHPDNFFVGQERLSAILAMHKGKKFVPYTVTTIGNVSAEVGDSIQINTVKGQVLDTFITDYEYIYNGVFNATYSSDVQTSEKERFTSTAPTRPDDFVYKEEWLEEYNQDKDDIFQEIEDNRFTESYINKHYAEFGTALVNRMWVGNLMADYVKAVEISANKINTGSITAFDEKFKINLDDGRLLFKHDTAQTGTSAEILASWYPDYGYRGMTIGAGSNTNSYVTLGYYNSTTKGWTNAMVVTRDNLTSAGFTTGVNITAPLQVRNYATFNYMTHFDAQRSRWMYVGTSIDASDGKKPCSIFNNNGGQMSLAILLDGSTTSFSPRLEITYDNILVWKQINMNGNKIINLGTLEAYNYELKQPTTYRLGGLKRQVAETYSDTIEYTGSTLVEVGETFIEIPAEVQGVYKVFVTTHGCAGYVTDQATDGFTVYADKATLCDYLIKAEKPMTLIEEPQPEEPEAIEATVSVPEEQPLMEF